MTGLTETQFAWLMAVLVAIVIVGAVWLGARRRVVEPEAEQRARDFILGDHPDWTDPEPITTADLDAIDRNVWHGTPMPEAEESETTPDGLCCTDPTRTADRCFHGYYGKPERCPFAEKRWPAELRAAETAAEEVVLRRLEIAELDRPETIAEVQSNERFARMAQPEMTRRRPIGSDPNDELTAPVEHADPRRAELRAVARSWADALGMDQVDDRQARRTGGSAS